MFSTPKDGLMYMYNSHVLEKDSCYDPETEEAVVILDALVRLTTHNFVNGATASQISSINITEVYFKKRIKQLVKSLAG
jgi:hypothetical protein